MVILIPFCFPMVDKNVRYLADKQFRHPHSERKAGVIFVSFNGVYCLPRHTQLPGQFTLAPPSCLAIVFQTVFQLALLGDKSSLQFEHLPVKNSCHLRKIGCLVGDCCYWFRCPYSGLSAFHPIVVVQKVVTFASKPPQQRSPYSWPHLGRNRNSSFLKYLVKTGRAE